MSALVDLIKKIGIFMIAAQAVIHFAPAQKYEKYMKFIVGILIVLQFLTPVYRILTGTEWEKITSVSESVWEMQAAGEKMSEEIAGTDFLADTVLQNLENEIKSKLNMVIPVDNCRVTGVRVSMRTLEEQGENDITQYEIERIRVVVQWKYAADGVLEQDIVSGTEKEQTNNAQIEKEQTERVEIEEIQIDKIAVGTDAMPETAAVDARTQKEKELQKIFSRELGMEEEKLEVVIYGMEEEVTR